MDPPYETLSAIRPNGGGRHRTAARTNARIRLSAGRTPTRHGAGGCLIREHLSMLPCDGERTDSQLRLHLRPHGGVVVAATRPNDLTGTEVGGHGEDHRSVCRLLGYCSTNQAKRFGAMLPAMARTWASPSQRVSSG